MSANKKTFTFTENTNRLDVFLTQELQTYPRNLVQQIIKKGGVKVNGKIRKPAWPLAQGDVVEVILPQNKATLNLKDLIVAQTKDFFVINKPAGILVHPQSPAWETNPQAAFATEETLISAILSAPPPYFDKATPRAGLVHRLDKETSGIMLIAKNEDFQTAMTEMFANRQMHKTYNAICCGEVPDNEGTINVPIGRLAGGKIKASELGREAITNYKVIKRKNGFSYMELYPLTGRTNQLRVHLSWLGYPVLGDWLYKGASAPRLMLHAKKLQFKHPFTAKTLKFEAAPPADFRQAWKEHTK